VSSSEQEDAIQSIRRAHENRRVRENLFRSPGKHHDVKEVRNGNAMDCFARGARAFLEMRSPLDRASFALYRGSHAAGTSGWGGGGEGGEEGGGEGDILRGADARDRTSSAS